MEGRIERYEILIGAINDYSKTLEEITDKISKIKLSSKEEQEFIKIVDEYDEKELMTEYLNKKIEKLDKRTKLCKYLQLYKEGIATNEEISTLVNYVAELDATDE